jgi:magnesium transporter
MKLDTAKTLVISRYLRANDLAAIAAELRHTHPADIVAALRDMPLADIARVLLCLDQPKQAQLFGYFDTDLQSALARTLDRREMARIFGQMPHDERADLFGGLDEAQRQSLLPGLAQAERDDLIKLSGWPPNTAGAIMTSDYATLPPDLTTVQAVAHLRLVAPDAETIYHSYVVDGDRRLIGTVSLRDLIVAKDDATVADVMRHDPPAIRTGDPRQNAVRVISKYDLLAVPVLDDDNRLAGIVTYDDALDVQKEETDISFVKTSAVAGLGTNMLQASASLLYRKRVPWLVILVFGNIFSGAGIAYFEDTIAAYVALVFFLPLLVDSGGNAGSQSATLMVRALATGDVRMTDWGRMLGREVMVAGALGLTMAAAVSVIGVVRGGPEIAMVVSLTMMIVVIVGSLIGMSLPFLLNRLKLDPAAASAPLITSLADAIGVIIYFSMATWILDLSAVGI